MKPGFTVARIDLPIRSRIYQMDIVSNFRAFSIGKLFSIENKKGDKVLTI